MKVKKVKNADKTIEELLEMDSTKTENNNDIYLESESIMDVDQFSGALDKGVCNSCLNERGNIIYLGRTVIVPQRIACQQGSKDHRNPYKNCDINPEELAEKVTNSWGKIIKFADDLQIERYETEDIFTGDLIILWRVPFRFH